MDADNDMVVDNEAAEAALQRVIKDLFVQDDADSCDEFDMNFDDVLEDLDV